MSDLHFFLKLKNEKILLLEGIPRKIFVRVKNEKPRQAGFYSGIDTILISSDFVLHVDSSCLDIFSPLEHGFFPNLMGFPESIRAADHQKVHADFKIAIGKVKVFQGCYPDMVRPVGVNQQAVVQIRIT